MNLKDINADAPANEQSDTLEVREANPWLRVYHHLRIVLRTRLPFLKKGIGRAFPPEFADTLPTRTAGGGRLRIAVIGDFGKDTPEMAKLCKVMAARHSQEPYDVVVSVGDAIYAKQRGATLQGWLAKCFPTLIADKVPFYSAVGNEDVYPRWRNEVLSEPLLNLKGRRYFRLSGSDPRTDFFFLDSNTLRKRAPDRPAQLKWLKQELAASTAQWKIVILHHPMHSSDVQRGPGVARTRLLEPIFQKYKVDLVLNGHNHMYERFDAIGGIRYIQCGGTSWPNRLPVPDERLSACINTQECTYLELTLSEDGAEFCAVDEDGREFDSGSWVKAEVSLAAVQ